jgi:DNA modification methylase
MKKLYNDDCFNVFPLIKDKSVNMVLVDLPYGQTDCHWDICLDLVAMWKELKRIGTDNCQYVFFTTSKYGFEIINSNKRMFKYDLVWEKPTAVGFLSAKHQPLRAHEMIYIFNNSNKDDVELCLNKELRAYAEKVKKYINKPMSQLKKDFGNRTYEHFVDRCKTSQFNLPTKETYDKLISLYGIDKMEGFMSYEDMKKKEEKQKSIIHLYNPQMVQGKPYKTKRHLTKTSVYGVIPANETNNESGLRYPRSVIKFHQNGDKLHPTQKPLDLCEWLIKTYSNEGDLVLDFCMGSGSTIEACINTNRQYIGIEKDKEIYKIARERIKSK